VTIELYDRVINIGLVVPRPIPTLVTMLVLTYVLPLGTISMVGSIESLTLSDMDTSLKPDGAWTHLIPAPVGLATNDARRFYPRLQAWSHIPLEDPLSASGADGSAFVDISSVPN